MEKSIILAILRSYRIPNSRTVFTIKPATHYLQTMTKKERTEEIRVKRE